MSNMNQLTAAKSAAIGNMLWSKQPKANAEFFALTYGALIGELLRDVESPDLVKSELDRMGYSIGCRCIEEFLAKTAATSETPVSVGGGNFQETPEILKMALRMFFGINADCKWNQKSESQPGGADNTSGAPTGGSGNVDSSSTTSFSLFFSENPFTLFVELPDDLADTNLQYNQLLAGWCRGVLELLQFECECGTLILFSVLKPFF